MGYPARQVFVITTPAKNDWIFQTKREAESKCPIGYSVQQRYSTRNWFGETSLVPFEDEYKYTKIGIPDLRYLPETPCSRT